MGRKKQEGERIIGPHEHHGRWRVVIVAEDGARSYEHRQTRGEAEEFAQELRDELARRYGLTIAEAIDEYEGHMTQKGNLAASVRGTVYRLNWFFGDQLDTAIGDITPEMASGMYLAFAKGKAADSHRNVLAEVKTFARKWVADKIVTTSPFETVAGIGKRQTGKPQLRRDEARRWLDLALERAVAGDALSLAAAMALTMGLRASEILKREARDVDDDGALLVIDRAKTRHGDRTVPVPDLLRELLLARVERVGHGVLFDFHRHSLLRRVQEICEAANVPRVCTHSLRGFLTTAAVRSGVDPNLVATYVGHSSAAVTLGNYVAPGTFESEQKQRGLRVLVGGRRG